MIKNVMTDEELASLEIYLSTLKKEFNIKSDELCEMHEEIKKIEFELKNQKILSAAFDEVFAKNEH
ncbi:hypothetical protein [Bacillus pseudomycoides]|uniref:hypothetical protein n=1 Tax=Bacillus pseudomycoides TaxID=64104 RepID=UPI000BEFDE47|nr:hypothetical protein [Bacillus pseudomycoides]PEJ40023.1 hypothetical protein CN677_01825 [Bacillus pseudomycoides]PHA94491.1 hypothetical protein COE78_12875 [Bacillus pseudomycoides]PHC71178.1 hypothetical protein COF38_23810 [Bacillus pseudomycoides]